MGLHPDHRPQSADIFEVVRWKTASEVGFSNISNGSRIAARDGTFRVFVRENGIFVADYREDLDGDGIDDLWAVTHFGHTPLTPAELEADPDEDGLSNKEEEIAGTDPFSGESVFRLFSLARPGEGPVSLRFTHVSGKFYRVWTSVDLVSWTEIDAAAIKQHSNGVSEWIEHSAPPGGQQFYRISVE